MGPTVVSSTKNGGGMPVQKFKQEMRSPPQFMLKKE
jgi:hypothetical protein